MPSYIALLRAINVGGRNRVPMADLRSLVGDLGFLNVRTLLQSGNLVFSSEERSTSALESMLEVALAEKLGVRTDLIVRTQAEWRTAMSANPFPSETKSDPTHLVIVFMKNVSEDKAIESLRAAIKGREVVHACGRELYAVYPDGIGESKLTMGVIESKLGSRGTARNWNTVLKLAELARG